MPQRLHALAANTTKVSVVTAKIAGLEVDREHHVERRDRHERQRVVPARRPALLGGRAS